MYLKYPVYGAEMSSLFTAHAFPSAVDIRNGPVSPKVFVKANVPYKVLLTEFSAREAVESGDFSYGSGEGPTGMEGLTGTEGSGDCFGSSVTVGCAHAKRSAVINRIVAVLSVFILSPYPYNSHGEGKWSQL